MKTVLAIDVAKGKSMVSLITDCGEVLIEPYEINHSKFDFDNLNQKISNFNLDNVSVIMESTGIYHRPIERYFKKKNYNVYTINALYSKMYKRNLRKTKTDKLDCISLSELFFTTDFRKYVKPNELYLNMNALSRQYFALSELDCNLKNRYKNLVYLCFPEYELLFKNKAIYSDIALMFINKYPHADIIANTRIDGLQNFFKQSKYGRWKSKPIKIKEYAKQSYPSVSKNDEIVLNLSSISKLIFDNKKEIENLKNKLEYIFPKLIKQTNLVPNKIRIRNIKYAWGSCSSNKNITINLKLVDKSEEEIKYVALHELCHLKYMNHSDKFWNLVGKYMPNYKEIRKQLKH